MILYRKIIYQNLLLIKPRYKTSSQIEDPFYQTLLESMFRHKRLFNALDQLNEKVTDYRQWTLRRSQGGSNNYGDDQVGGKKGKKKKKQSYDPGNDTLVVAGGFNSRKRGLNLGGHEGASGLFIGSLSGMATEGYMMMKKGVVEMNMVTISNIQ